MSRTAPAGRTEDTGSAIRTAEASAEAPAEASAAASAEAVYGLLSSLIHHGPRDMSLTSRATLATLERTGPRRITDLAAIAGVTQPSMTTLAGNLERAGLVERRSAPDDRRVVLVAITAAGADYLHTRRQASVEVFAALIDKLTADEAAALDAAVPALRRLRELDEEQRDPAPVRTGG